MVDSRNHPPQMQTLQREFPDLSLYCGGFDEQMFVNAGEIILSPGVSLREPAVQAALAAGVSVSGDIELFMRNVNAPIIAITGSNGKSTVTTLVRDMLKAQGLKVCVGGNLGPPALDLLRAKQPAVDYFVLELSSFQLEITHTLRTHTATVLNISPDHLDRHVDPAGYAKTKSKIYRDCRYPVVNRDDRLAAALCESTTPCGYSLDLAPDSAFTTVVAADGERWVAHNQQPVLALSSMALFGRHNVANVLAACALAYHAGVAYPAMATAVSGYRGLAHRCELVLESDGRRWINDSKGTNVGATAAALHGFGASSAVVLIAGGDAKGADFAPLRSAVRNHARRVILLGRDGARIGAQIADAAPIIYVQDLAEAVKTAVAVSKPGDTVLFSPACASYDMFTDYAARGEAFQQAVYAVITA